jgi:nicotinamide mononucleotide (NMN) deamidase PncC
MDPATRHLIEMDPATRHLIEAIHQAPFGGVLALTGGGTAAAGMLLAVPGGSRTILEVLVPYQERALVELLGRRPEQFCSAATSREMAHRAYDRARWLAPGRPVIGLGCTASLATDRPKRGEHRFHIAVDDGVQTATHSLILTKGARDRDGEEAILDAVLLTALAQAFGINETLLPPPLLPGEEVKVEAVLYDDPLSAFFNGRWPVLCVEPDGRMSATAARPAVLLPGSFNPVHAGHWGLAAVAARRVGGTAAFEMSVVNVDKPPLPREEVRRRLGQVQWQAPLWLTRAPTFAEKAELFPGVVFAVGADTAVRIVQPRYYGDSEERMIAALAAIRERGCRFLVAGRRGADGRFQTLADIPLPAAAVGLFEAIPESAFHLDISSTQLRAAQARSADEG